MKKEYSEEFRMDAVRLAQSGDVSAAQVARELGVNHHTLYNWIENYGLRPEGPDGTVEDLAAELLRIAQDRADIPSALSNQERGKEGYLPVYRSLLQQAEAAFQSWATSRRCNSNSP